MKNPKDTFPPEFEEVPPEETLQRLATMGELTAGLVHQARNLMTGILSFSQVGKKRASQPSPSSKTSTAELFAHIETETLACLDLFDQVMRASSDTSSINFQTPKAEPVSELVASAERLTQNHLRIHNVRLDVSAVEDCEVVAFRDVVVQALLNLIVNAMHASPASGTVTMRTEVANNHADIVICDQGGGVPVEFRKKIFEPFFTTKEPGVGTGLGLSTSRRQLRGSGGDLTLDESESGASFRIRLPRSKKA